MTIYSINRDQSASYIKHNLSYGDRIDNVLVITVYDLNAGPVIDHLIKQFPGLTNGEAK